MGATMDSSETSQHFAFEKPYQLSTGCTLRFLNQNEEEAYAEDILHDVRWDITRLNYGMAFLVCVFTFYWAILYMFLLADGQNIGYPLLMFQFYFVFVVLAALTSACIPRQHSEWYVVGTMAVVQVALLNSNVYRLHFFGIVDEDDIWELELGSIESGLGTWIRNRDWVHNFMVLFLGGVFFSVSRVRTRRSWLVPAAASIMALINSFLTLSKEENVITGILQTVLLSLSGFSLWVADSIAN